MLDDLITRFGDSDDPGVARFTAWALRNRIERLLAVGSREEAIATVDRLAAVNERVALKPVPREFTEQLVAVWMLLAKNGFGEEANRLIGPNMDRGLVAVDRELASGRAQALVGMLLAAYRTGDQDGVENAMTGLHNLGEPVLAEIDGAVAQRTAASAILLLQKVPVLVDLGRAAEAHATLDQIEQLLSSDPSSDLREVVLELRTQLDSNEGVPDESLGA